MPPIGSSLVTDIGTVRTARERDELKQRVLRLERALDAIERETTLATSNPEIAMQVTRRVANITKRARDVESELSADHGPTSVGNVAQLPPRRLPRRTIW